MPGKGKKPRPQTFSLRADAQATGVVGWTSTWVVPSGGTLPPQGPFATPYPPPTLGSRGSIVQDAVFGHRIVRISDASDALHNTHSYSSRSALNYDNTQLLFDIGGVGWVVRGFTPSTLAVGSDWTVPAPSPLVDPMIWDFSGSHNTRLYGSIAGSRDASRYFWRADVGDAGLTTLTNSTFSTNVRVSGTITTSTSSTSFKSTTIVSPITDMTQHFFVNQLLHFTSGPRAGEEQIISAFASGTGTFTTAAFTGAPNVGDAFYVTPAGYNTQFDASPDGTYLAVGVAHEDGQGQDNPHILVVYNTSTQAIQRVRYFSQADFNNQTPMGIHRLGFDRAPGSTKIWVDVNGAGQTFVLYDFQSDSATAVNASLGHEDASADDRMVCTGTLGIGIRSANTPATVVDCFISPDKSFNGQTATGAPFIDYHQSWGETYTRPNEFTNSGSLSFAPSMTNTGWVADGAPIYRWDNFRDLYVGRMLDLVDASGSLSNLPAVWDTTGVLTFMGTGKASITGSGQWAYDSTASSGKGSLWVRANADKDLTSAGNSGIVAAFDWRVGQDEIFIVDLTAANPARLLARCKTYNWASFLGVDPTVSETRGSMSRDGKFVVFASTWGNTQRVDVFVAEMR